MILPLAVGTAVALLVFLIGKRRLDNKRGLEQHEAAIRCKHGRKRTGVCHDCSSEFARENAKPILSLSDAIVPIRDPALTARYFEKDWPPTISRGHLFDNASGACVRCGVSEVYFHWEKGKVLCK